jgi:hypothetical protein
MNEATCHIEDRLTESDFLRGRIVPFLDDRSVVMFSSCNHSLRLQLPIVRLPVEISNPPIMIGRHDDGDDFGRCTLRIPAISYSTRTRSVKLCGRWRDQGWGNRKGQVAILASSDSTPSPPPEKLSYSNLEQDGAAWYVSRPT